MSRNGWIIQHLTTSVDLTECNGPRKTLEQEFWEAWEVREGKIWAGFKDPPKNPNPPPDQEVGTEHQVDIFGTKPQENSRGKAVAHGRVRFIEDYNLTVPPWAYKEIAQAHRLPTIGEEPFGFTDCGAHIHRMEVEWDCCDDPKTQTIRTVLRQRPLLVSEMARLGRRIFGGGIPAEKVLDKIPIPEPSVSSEASRVVDLIASIPDWRVVALTDNVRREEVVSLSRRVARHDLDVVREAIQAYSRRQPAGSYDVAAMCRLYVLNRVLFDVPDRPAGARGFSGFSTAPFERESERSELWPLSQNREHRLVLTGTFQGYFGEPYLAVEEFDYFLEKYGVRR